MYKLLAAAQAREFSVGCQAKWSNFDEKSYVFPFASSAVFSAPATWQVFRHIGWEKFK